MKIHIICQTLSVLPVSVLSSLLPASFLRSPSLVSGARLLSLPLHLCAVIARSEVLFDEGPFPH